jgi:hypothetical protein
MGSACTAKGPDDDVPRGFVQCLLKRVIGVKLQLVEITGSDQNTAFIAKDLSLKQGQGSIARLSV